MKGPSTTALSFAALAHKIGETIAVRIEVPRGGRVKRGASGRIEFISPFACPYNYGSVEGASLAPDGDGFDALVLGPRARNGEVVSGRVLGVVDFLDGGVPDAKLVVGSFLSEHDRYAITRFFMRYARIKRLLRLTRQTQYRGWVESSESAFAK